ncbi:uncharacterized protein LOC130736445 [Lotus japonicus]|uniref:uncharacterized protein LOC130736445 n=1 Tax=Lotus japonicus TaxID=34305 RepID=UPI00259048FF|nr:uncharacterized protein LOC130736445 [Lotus japonicus]
MKDDDKLTEELDELNVEEKDEEEYTVEENVEEKDEEDYTVECDYAEETLIDGSDATMDINNEDDILRVDLKNFCAEKISKLSFISLDVAYLFYTWYGRVNVTSRFSGATVVSC